MAVDPSTAPRRLERVRVRRNVRWLAAGILAMALGGLGTWALFASVADTRPALKVTHTVYRGQPIQAGDLAVVAIGRGTDVDAVSGDELNRVIGQTAVTDLPAGGLLVARAYGAPELAAGVARVGLRLDAGAITNAPLRPGARVLLVFVPGATAAVAGSPAPPPASVEATVAAEPQQAADGAHLVDVDVPLASAEAVARAAATKQIVLVRMGEG